LDFPFDARVCCCSAITRAAFSGIPKHNLIVYRKDEMTVTKDLKVFGLNKQLTKKLQHLGLDVKHITQKVYNV